jgi:glutamate/aspartate transport system permease protein|tara:strand:+ start:732 stop:1391 length:660 start_codon:yes stop_codon:yes gene_type:complete
MFGQFDYQVIYDNLDILWDGMLITLLLTGVAILGGILFGTLLALMRLSRFTPISIVAGRYVDAFRSTPLILVIFWFYFAVPLVVGRPIGDLYSVLIAFTLFEAAYYCEIIRAGIQSIRRPQIHAGLALGLTPWQTTKSIVLPQAFRNMVPVLLTQAIVLFQDTSLVYVVGLKDFLTAADLVAVRDNRVVELYLAAAVVYFVLCIIGSLWVKRLQRQYAI